MTKSEKFIYDESNDLAVIFENQSYDDPTEELERRYKVVVMTVLPFLLSRMRVILCTTSFFLGVLFTCVISITLLRG